MKEFLRYTCLFLILSFLASCAGTASNNTANNANANGRSNGQRVVTVVPPSSPTDSPTDSPTEVSKPNFPPLRAGLAAAEFELLDGGKIKLADKKGKVLLVNIWGIWCGPCRAEMPHLVELQEKYRDQGLEIIGLNIGDGNANPEPIDAIKKFAADMKLNYTIARADQASTREFYLLTKQSVVPQTILVSREGNLRGVFIGGGDRVFNSMKESVAKLLADKPA